jgi:hypothetical protein
MAFGAWGGLAQGLAQGMQMGWNQQERERQAARQAKLDAQNEQLFGERMNALRDERENRENQKAIDQAIADAGKAGQVEDAAGVTYTNPNGEQKTAYQPDQATAQFAAQQQSAEEALPGAAPATPSNPTATTATSVRDLAGNRKLFTGLNAAADAKTFADQNQPGSYAQYMALRNKLSGMVGGQKAADEYLKRAKEAQQEGVFETLLELKSKNPDPNKAKSIFNSTGTFKLSDSQNFAPDVGADGKPTGKWNIVETDADGNQKVVLPDVETFAQQRILGVQGLKDANKAQLELQRDIAKENAKPVVVPMGGAFIPGKGDQRQPFVNENNLVPALDSNGQPMFDDNGKPLMVRPTKGGASASAGGAPGKVPDAIEKALKGNESGIATATELAAAFRANNPGMPVDQANGLGIRAATGANRRAVFNPNTGMFDEYFDDKPTLDKDGKPTGFATNKSYLIQSHQYSDKGAVPAAQAQQAVADMQKTLPKAQFDSYVAASSPEAYKAYSDNSNAAFTALVNKAKSDIAAVQADTTLTPQQKAEKLQTIQNAVAAKQQDMQADLRRLDLVRQFYKAPPANTPPNTPPAGTNTDWRTRYLGLNAATPDPNSPAGRSLARKQALAAEQQQRDQQALAAQQALSKQYAIDKASMNPVDFVRKYDSLRGNLPASDAADLQQFERNLR